MRQVAGHHPGCVITLIHGTFARDAAWVRDGSMLRSNLEKAIGPGCYFEVFRWSGRNSPAGRAKAAKSLAEHIHAVARQHPTLPHYLIAHSHGGNVALYALRPESVRRHVHALVFLSTPFIHANARAYSDESEFGMMIMGWSLVATPIWLGLKHLLPVMPVLAENLLMLAAFVLALPLTLAIGAALVFLAMGREEGLEVPEISVPAMIVRVPGDEAAGVLTFSHFLTYVFNKPIAVVLSPVGWIAEAVGTRIEPLWKSGVIGKLIALTLVALVAKYVGVGLALLGVFCLAITLLSGVLLSAFGVGFGLTSALLEVTAEPTPVGRWTVHHFASRAQLVGMTDGVKFKKAPVPFLAHSGAYEHPFALQAVSRFLADLVQAGDGDRSAIASQ